MWEWCSCSPVGAGARAEVSNRSCGRRGTQPLPEHRQEGWEHMWKGCVCVCVCVQTSGSLSSLASLPPTHAYHWPSSTRRQRAGESQGCSLYWSASWAWSRAEKGGERTSGRIQSIFSTGAYRKPALRVSL